MKNKIKKEQPKRNNKNRFMVTDDFKLRFIHRIAGTGEAH